MRKRSKEMNEFLDMIDDVSERKSMKRQKKVELKKLTMISLIEYVINETIDEDFDSCITMPCVVELGKRLEIPAVQALLLAVFVKNIDDRNIEIRDIARHFDSSTIHLMAYQNEIDALVQHNAIIRRKDRMEHHHCYSYLVPVETVQALSREKMPEPLKLDGLSIQQFVQAYEELFRRFEEGEMDDPGLEVCFGRLIAENQHLKLARTLRKLDLSYPYLKLYLAMSLCYINDADDQIGAHDIGSYFETRDMRMYFRSLNDPNHVLIRENLIENYCEDGIADSKCWSLTDYSKFDVFEELELSQVKDYSGQNGLKYPDSIQDKQLYYNDDMMPSIKELYTVFDVDRMEQIMEKLEEQGQRKGFPCLFYGGPGTGKTETVLQLARATGRAIMQVEIPAIRDKYVGETEKNIKRVFVKYHRLVKEMDVTPILFFNEADALFNTRSDETSAVDKMENAMQNIILQEMENFEGILIATTNLASSMDPAFERRFLYKLKFDKPLAGTRRHIWKNMLPELSDDEAYKLADRFDFSGGQIENIARKRLISELIHDCDRISFDELVNFCNAESIQSAQNHRSVGFI